MAPKTYTLSRNEILRGFRSFDKVFKKSSKVSSVNITAYIQKLETPAGIPARAGFFVSKKKLKKLTSAIE